MKKYIDTIEKNKVDELMEISKKLDALTDLKCTLLDLQDRHQPEIDVSEINPKMIDKEIAELSRKKEKKYEEIRLTKGWSKEFMSKVRILDNYKVYLETE